MWLIVFLILAFLVGSIPFSFIIGKRVKNIDLRLHGSGNLGSTNVFRTLGPAWGIPCLALDMGKGAAAVALMTWLVNTWPIGDSTPFNITPDLFRIFAGVIASLGHTFSPFVGFHGGKGVATTGGAFAVLEPIALLITLVAFGAVFATTRIVSLGSITAAIVLPIFVFLFEIKSLETSKTIIVFTLLICGFVLFKHRANIHRLRDGTEGKIDPTQASDRPQPTSDSDSEES
ncbi:MAG: glycerol-3-phosphate acyltransferase PlsY [Candidatus Krumholzibacteriia bacterium]|jgi:glycerol-3-phosphate acyltransferase PlsY